MSEVAEIASKLTDRQREALLNCEAKGNGAYPFCLHPFAKLGLMALMPVPKLLGISAYRLTGLGRAVRDHIAPKEPI